MKLRVNSIVKIDQSTIILEFTTYEVNPHF